MSADARRRAALAAWLAVSCRLPALDEVIWEKNGGWGPSDQTYFAGARCEVDGAAPCPREMGWQGNQIAWSFAVPADVAKTAALRFELVVTDVYRPVAVAVSIGAAGGATSRAGELAIGAPGVFRLAIPSERFAADSRNEIELRGDNPTGFGEPSGIRWSAAGLYRHYTTAPPAADEELLDDAQWRACRYFYEQALPNGFVLDTLGAEAASIAAVGFGATAMTILAERAGAGAGPRWTIPAAAARARVESMLDAVLAIQGRQAGGGDEEWGFAGIPYHFVDAAGRRARGSEVSTIDGALMIAGFLQAGAHFGGELAAKAEAVFRAVDFKRFYRSATNRYRHGWRPGSGFIPTEWDRPGDETFLVCFLALAQDPADAERLRACYGYPRESESYQGIPVVRSYFGSLFTYTFAHQWLPFECFGADRPAAAGLPGVAAVDWWLNSRRAVEANRRYHRDRLDEFPALGAESWGASACYRADRLEYFGRNGSAPAEAEPAFDGTLPPHGAIMSIFLARTADGESLDVNPAFAALRHYYRSRFSTLWCSYGPRSSFDHRGNTSGVVVGIEKGPEALGIEAYRTGRPSRTLLGNPAIAAAAARVFERSACPAPPQRFVRGRVNPDLAIDIADPVFLLSYLFARGARPACEDAADANDDGSIDIGDAIVLLAHLFGSVAAFQEPFPACGTDPTPDELECAAFPACPSR